MYFPGTCPECNTRGLEAHLAEPVDYLKCEKCGWRSDRPRESVLTAETAEADQPAEITV